MSHKTIAINLPHHQKIELCRTRPPYRQGRKFTAVKVYTISKESPHLLIYEVPSVGLQKELLNKCKKFGETNCFIQVKSYKQNNELTVFTEVFHVCYTKLKCARLAKKHLDNLAFYGGTLHVCYAPELETIPETRSKLIQRRKDISIRTQTSAQNKYFKVGNIPQQPSCSWDERNSSPVTSRIICQDSLKRYHISHTSSYEMNEENFIETETKRNRLMFDGYKIIPRRTISFSNSQDKEKLQGCSNDFSLIKKFIPRSVYLSPSSTFPNDKL